MRNLLYLYLHYKHKSVRGTIIIIGACVQGRQEEIILKPEGTNIVGYYYIVVQFELSNG